MSLSPCSLSARARAMLCAFNVKPCAPVSFPYHVFMYDKRRGIDVLIRNQYAHLSECEERAYSSMGVTYCHDQSTVVFCDHDLLVRLYVGQDLIAYGPDKEGSRIENVFNSLRYSGGARDVTYIDYHARMMSTPEKGYEWNIAYP
jgi:hypothetical protein